MTVIVPSRPARPIRVDGGGRIPAGGTTGQALVKSADADYATTWATASGGGGVTDGDKGDITVSGSGAAWTIDNGAVTVSKMADLAASTILGNNTGGAAAPIALSAAQATALLDVFTSGAKGLVPASGGGTTNFLRADGTFAAPPGGGGSPGGSTNDIQINNGGAFAGAADFKNEGGQLRLPAIATPTTPAAGGLKLFGRDIAGRMMPAFSGPSGLDSALQPHLGYNSVGIVRPSSGTTLTSIGIAWTGLGTATTENPDGSGNLYAHMQRVAWRVTTASTTAVAGGRFNSNRWTVGGNTAGLGGFSMAMRWGQSTGAASTTRAFVGMRDSVIPTDVDPSTLTNICGMGWDASDTNIQFIHNDGSGTATKIDLGASFPKPTANQADVYELAMFSPPNGVAQSVGYRITNLATGAVATGFVTTNLPSGITLLTTSAYISVGGVSSVIGFTLMGLYVESDY